MLLQLVTEDMDLEPPNRQVLPMEFSLLGHLAAVLVEHGGK